MINKIVQKFQSKPYLIEMGAGKLAKMFNTDRDSIYKAKEIYRGGDPVNIKAPKILLLDIETALSQVAIFQQRRKVFIRSDQVLSDWFILSWVGKWLYDEETFGDIVNSHEALEEDDTRVCESLWNALDTADIVIAHNGDNFDVPKVNTRFLIHGFPPPSAYKTIDTLKVAQVQFGFSYNSLEAIAKVLGIEAKMHTDFQLWLRCMHGDEEALKYMLEYNEQDVIVLEKVYLALRPYIRNHPNYNLYIDSVNPVCPTCGHDKLNFVGYYYYTPTGKYRDYRCSGCGALCRERKSVLENRKTIMVSNGK